MPDIKDTILSETPAIAATASVKNCRLGRYTEINDGTRIAESSLDDYSYIMERCDIISTEIGKFVNIASEVRINPGNHPMEWVSQHHFLYRRRQYRMRDTDLQTFFDWRKRQKVTIGHDVWIGHKAIVLPGIRIGNGVVIGAGSVVTRDVAPYAIVAGVPAKQIRLRFPQAIWQAVEATGWYHWSHETLRERLDDFYDIHRFLDMYGQPL